MVAEGVSDPLLWRMAAASGCDLAQGFGVGRPIPPEALPAWMAAWSGAALPPELASAAYAALFAAGLAAVPFLLVLAVRELPAARVSAFSRLRLTPASSVSASIPTRTACSPARS